MIGYHSDMIWLPGQNVGAVVLTNGDPGWLIRGRFSRKLLEVLFDGRPEADASWRPTREASSLVSCRSEAAHRARGRARKHQPRKTLHQSSLGDIAVSNPAMRRFSTSASGKAKSPAAKIRMAQSRLSRLYLE